MAIEYWRVWVNSNWKKKRKTFWMSRERAEQIAYSSTLSKFEFKWHRHRLKYLLGHTFHKSSMYAWQSDRRNLHAKMYGKWKSVRFVKYKQNYLVDWIKFDTIVFKTSSMYTKIVNYNESNATDECLMSLCFSRERMGTRMKMKTNCQMITNWPFRCAVWDADWIETTMCLVMWIMRTSISNCVTT